MTKEKRTDYIKVIDILLQTVNIVDNARDTKIELPNYIIKEIEDKLNEVIKLL